MRARHLALLALVGGATAVAPRALAVVRPRMGGHSAASNSALRVRGGHADMSLAALAGTVCPSLGVVLCNALYFTPLTAAMERSKAGSLGNLNPLPAALTVLSNIAWLSYGEAATFWRLGHVGTCA